MNLSYRNLFATLVFFGISTIASAQHVLRLNVEGVETEKGSVCYAIYTDENSFLKVENVYKSGATIAVAGKTTIKIKDLPDGDYAIAIFHDVNDNEKLDTNMLGIPKEQFAFSKGKMKMFGPPKFEECVFTFNSDLEITINLK